MKTSIWVYVAVIVLSAGAGLAIAGIPDTSPREPTIIPPSTTEAPDPLEQLSEAAAEEAEAAAPDTTTAPATTAAEVPATTSTTTTVADVPLLERDEFTVVVANGADIGGVAADTSVSLVDLGYAEAITVDGTEIVNQTIIYAADEFTEFAERLSEDLRLPSDRVQPLEDVPEILIDPDADARVVVYLGADIQLVLLGLGGDG